MNSLNNPTIKLYTDTSKIPRNPTIANRSAIKMISMINETTSIDEFKTAWKNNHVYKLEMRGLDISCRGGTGLHMAAHRNNLELTLFFIKHLERQNIDSVSTTTWATPLMEAVNIRKSLTSIEARKTNLKIIRKLLIAGADPNLSGYLQFCIDWFNISPLSVALDDEDLKLTKLLLKFGAHKFYALFKKKNANALIKQQFIIKKNEIYKQAKIQLKEEQIKLIGDKAIYYLQGIHSFQDEDCVLNHFPPEVVSQIFTSDIWNISGRAESSNQKRIDEAKRVIEAKGEIIIGNYGTSLMLANTTI